MQIKILLIFVFVNLTSTLPVLNLTKQERFLKFKIDHNKKYKNLSEENNSFEEFIANLDLVDENNLKYNTGKKTYKLELNKYSDLSRKIFLKLRTGFKHHNLNKPTFKMMNSREKTTPKSIKSLPKETLKLTTKIALTTTSLDFQEIDWRTRGAVTDVKDQGSCGSCWAFSSTGALEGQWMIKNHRLLPNLSEQNLVDCATGTDYSSYGCDGGSMTDAFNYIKVNNGIDDQNSYPYEAINGKCRFNLSNVAATNINYVDLPSGDEDALEKAVREIGPISVAIEVSNELAMYSTGIFSSTGCTNNLNHGVLIVGYNNTNIPPYWIVKNSWSTQWGENGYIRIEKNKNACGIADWALYPIV